MTDTTPFLEIRPRKTYNPQPQVAVLMITLALLGLGLHTLVFYMYVHTCVQTDVYTDVFLGARHAASRWQNRARGHLRPREEKVL